MATYLIDYENVKSEGIKGIAQLNEEDQVVIFYSHNADTITFEAMDMIFSSKAQVRKYKILCGGKNALDFQLATYLGYLIHEAKDSYFYIISKDNGFKHLVDFWKRTFHYDGYVYCFATIADGNARQNRFKNATAKERERVMEEELVAMSEELKAQEAQQEQSQIQEGEPSQTPKIDENESIEPMQEASNDVNEENMQDKVEEPKAEESVIVQENFISEENEKMEEAEDKTEALEVPLEALPKENKETVNEQQAEENNEIVSEVKASEKISAEEKQEEIVPDTSYFVQQSKQVSVMPPAQLPDSVRKELEKADAQYAENTTEDLKKKIEEAVSMPVIKVVENDMTVHKVAAEESVKKTEDRPKRQGRRRKNSEQAAEQKETVNDMPKEESKNTKKASAKATKTTDKKASQEKASEKIQKNTKTSRKPKETAKNAESKAEEKAQKPVRKNTSGNSKAKKEEVVVEEPKNEVKPARRGRRPKTQSNIAASFE